MIFLYFYVIVNYDDDRKKEIIDHGSSQPSHDVTDPSLVFSSHVPWMEFGHHQLFIRY